MIRLAGIMEVSMVPTNFYMIYIAEFFNLQERFNETKLCVK